MRNVDEWFFSPKYDCIQIKLIFFKKNTDIFPIGKHLFHSFLGKSDIIIPQCCFFNPIDLATRNKRFSFQYTLYTFSFFYKLINQNLILLSQTVTEFCVFNLQLNYVKKNSEDLPQKDFFHIL